MSGDFDPRDLESRERDDGIHDREDEWLTLGRGPHSAVVHDGDEDVRVTRSTSRMCASSTGTPTATSTGRTWRSQQRIIEAAMHRPPLALGSRFI